MKEQGVQLEANRRWPGDVEVWHVVMPASGFALDRTWLDEVERERAARYRQPEDRVRFTVTRLALRERLGQRLGVEPASLRFAVGTHGRLELAGFEGLSFNVSHSGEHALIAMSSARIVGIDIERIDPVLDWRELLGLVCTAEERRALTSAPVRLQRQRFFRCWTAKEAILKTLGLGIAQGLRALTVSPASESVQRPTVSGGMLFAAALDVQYHWLTDIPGYMGCIAYGGLLGEVRPRIADAQTSPT